MTCCFHFKSGSFFSSDMISDLQTLHVAHFDRTHSILLQQRVVDTLDPNQAMSARENAALVLGSIARSTISPLTYSLGAPLNSLCFVRSSPLVSAAQLLPTHKLGVLTRARFQLCTMTRFGLLVHCKLYSVISGEVCFQCKVHLIHNRRRSPCDTPEIRGALSTHNSHCINPWLAATDLAQNPKSLRRPSWVHGFSHGFNHVPFGSPTAGQRCSPL